MARVAILGTGLIGASIGMRLRGEKDITVVGYDRYRDAAQAAQRAGAVDEITGDPLRAVEGAGLVVIAVPILAMRKLMQEIGPALERGAVVTDTGSTKAEVMRWASLHLPRTVTFVGGHPMAGKTEIGAAAADARLFEGARWVVVPAADASEEAVGSVVGLAERTGAQPMFMVAEEHDAYVAAISHLPLAGALAMFRLAHSSEAWPEMSAMAAGGFKDFTRLASTDPAMAHDIAVTNREQLLHWIDRYREALSELRDLIAQPEGEEELFQYIAKANWEYDTYRAGKVGREEKPVGDVGSGFDMGSFLMGQVLKDKMAEITRDQEERAREEEARRRMRRDL